MNRIVKITLVMAGLMLLAAVGYWLGTRANVAKKDDLNAPQTARKLLYYRNPMGLSDTSDVPKKDAMGMDYVAVYDGDALASGASDAPDGFSISVAKVQKLGVQSEAASLRELHKTLRLTGRIEIDERRSYTIAPKFEGWIDKLYVNTTGQLVSKGQALFEVYSPELISAQSEHALALQGLAAMQTDDEEGKKSMRRLASASAARLKNWDVAAVTAHHKPEAQVTFRAPVSGIVLEKKAVQGMRFMPGDVLYQIADLSSVWVVAEVSEQDLAPLRLGSVARITVDAYPQSRFKGKVDFIYPILNSATRTVQLRIQVTNQQGRLKPAMFANAEIAVAKSAPVLSVPRSAIIDSGTRQLLLVRLAAGRFDPREVTLGRRSDDYVEVLSGVAAGEQVVVAANFLLDAESNLKAALSGMSSSAHTSSPPASEAVEVGRTSSRQVSQVRVEVGINPDLPGNIIAHQGRGRLVAINDNGSVSITHEAIKSLRWPGMTMDFALANAALLDGIATGSAITFEIVERAKDEWVITKMQAAPAAHAQTQTKGR
jgi:membrane fusion protein, copper/silver efflux system